MRANVGLVKTFIAAGVIAERRIVKFGSSDTAALQATAGTEKFSGVVGLPKSVTAAEGEPVDVILSGIADVDYGGNVTRGDTLTADANGRAVVATSGNSVIGIAQVSGVAGDIGSVHIQFSTLP